MKKTIIIFWILFSVAVFAQDSVKSVLVANINISKELNVSKSDVIKAANYALKISGKYEITEQSRIDSARKILAANPLLRPGPINTAIETESDEILFIGANKFGNMLRIDAAFVNTADTSIRKTGYGYQLMNFRDKETDQPIAQPSLIAACQRAFAAALDSNLYASANDDKFKVFPAETIVIGGLKYVDLDSLEEWELFEKKIVTSYEALEVIFEVASKHNDYVVYDLATRDSIYAVFRFYGVENYNKPTYIEIDALRKFQVDKMITGTLERIEKGAELTLFLLDITDEGIEIIEKEKTLVIHDNPEGFRNTIRFLTNKLIFDL